MTSKVLQEFLQARKRQEAGLAGVAAEPAPALREKYQMQNV